MPDDALTVEFTDTEETLGEIDRETIHSIRCKISLLQHMIGAGDDLSDDVRIALDDVADLAKEQLETLKC